MDTTITDHPPGDPWYLKLRNVGRATRLPKRCGPATPVGSGRRAATAETRQGPPDVWRNRDFGFLLGGQVVSSVGDQVQNLAVRHAPVAVAAARQPRPDTSTARQRQPGQGEGAQQAGVAR
jgi:hypothetical protein